MQGCESLHWLRLLEGVTLFGVAAVIFSFNWMYWIVNVVGKRESVLSRFAYRKKRSFPFTVIIPSTFVRIGSPSGLQSSLPLTARSRSSSGVDTVTDVDCWIPTIVGIIQINDTKNTEHGEFYFCN